MNVVFDSVVFLLSYPFASARQGGTQDTDNDTTTLTPAKDVMPDQNATSNRAGRENGDAATPTSAASSSVPNARGETRDHAREGRRVARNQVPKGHGGAQSVSDAAPTEENPADELDSAGDGRAARLRQPISAANRADLPSKGLSRQELSRQNDKLWEQVGDLEDVILNYTRQVERLEANREAQESLLLHQSKTLASLQQEVLANVDRHEPTFDESIVKAFVKVNRKIDALVRKPRRGAAQAPTAAMSLAKFAEAAPFEDWDERVLMSRWYDPQVRDITDRTPEVVSLLLRAVVWNILRRELFDPSRPFAVFGSSAAADTGHFFKRVFPDHETSQIAAKWRALTAKCLEGYESHEPKYRDQVQKGLLEAFAMVLHHEVGYKNKTPEEIRQVLMEDMFSQLQPVLLAAMELAALAAKERAGFTLEFPDLERMEYQKVENDPQLTNRPSDLGINAYGAGEEEAGPVGLVASPMLVKWGNGGGEHLTSSAVLCKAFVWRPRRD